MNFFLLAQPTPTSKFLQGYVGAVTSAVSLAVSVFIFQHHHQHLFLQLHFIFTVTVSEKGSKCCLFKMLCFFIWPLRRKMKDFTNLMCVAFRLG